MMRAAVAAHSRHQQASIAGGCDARPVTRANVAVGRPCRASVDAEECSRHTARGS